MAIFRCRPNSASGNAGFCNTSANTSNAWGNVRLSVYSRTPDRSQSDDTESRAPMLASASAT